MNGALAVGAAVGTPQGLAINGDYLTLVSWLTAFTQWVKHWTNFSGCKQANTRPKVSGEGMPLDRLRNLFSQSSLERPNSYRSTQLSAPQMTPHMVMAMISNS
jgi:hypothetical protein